MKKLFVLAVSLSLCLTMAACGESAPKTTSAPTPGATEVVETPTPTAEPTEESDVSFKPIIAASGESVTIDLDGDGADDTVCWSAKLKDDGSWEYDKSLTVNGTDVASTLEDMGYYCESVMDYWAVVDIDTSDSFKEIAIFDDGPSSDPNSIFFRYEGGALTMLGRVYGMWEIDGEKLYFPGDGTVESWCRLGNLQTWYAPCKWVYDTAADYGRFRCEPLSDDGLYYPTGSQTVTALMDIVLYTDADEASKTSSIATDTQFTILATDGGEWVLVELSDLTRGWLHVVDGFKVETTSGSVCGADAIDGLIYAD